MKGVVATVLLGCLALAQAQSSNPWSTSQLESSLFIERRQRDFFPVDDSFVLPVNGLTATTGLTDNAAGRQFAADKNAFPFLATLPHGGAANFITALKPCGQIMPHVHPRGNEAYIIISGQMHAGIAEENGGRQNTTFDVFPGQSFVVPQGLVHYNSNFQCSPLVFIQAFDSADPGTIGLNNAIVALKAVDSESLNASNFGSVTASPQGGFALDSTCLQKCGLSNTGGDLSSLSAELQTFLGLSNTPPAPVQAPAGPLSSG